MRIWICLAAVLALVLLSGCGSSPPPTAQVSAKKPSKKEARAETPPAPKPKPKPAVTVAQDAFPDAEQAIATLAAALKSSGDAENDKSEKAVAGKVVEIGRAHV